jgi:hypothetical protein
MTTQEIQTPKDTAMGEFIASIPTPKEIKDRLARNASESSVLKKLLKVAEAAEIDREVRAEHAE